jgi:branched-chain amino acid aminotransferase
VSAPFLAVWHGDGVVRGATIALDPADRGLTLGDGLFETAPVFNGHAVWLGEHLDRLMSGAAAIGLDITRRRIETAVAACLAEIGPTAAVLRITVTRGAGGRGLAHDGGAPTLLVTLAPWPKGILNRDVTLATARVRRNEYSPVSRLKSLSYLDAILAAREAASAGADDALMLNCGGRVASSTIANVFVMEDGRLVTPPESEGVLGGITRRKVLAAAHDLGFAYEEAPVERARLTTAHSVFLTNSLRLIRPVTRLDGEALPVSREPLTVLFEALCSMIADDCGVDPQKADRP